MSKLDLSTIIIVALCVFALGFLIWKTVGINNQKKGVTDTTQVVDPQDTSAEDYEFDDEGEIVSDDSGQANAGNAATTGDAVGGDGATAGGQDGSGTSTGQAGEEAADATNSNANGSAGSSTSSTNNSGSSTAANSGGSTTATQAKPTFYDDDSRGQYLVLAGAFRVRDNGVREARRIRRMGYPDAEMTLMDRGTYATVLVDRFAAASDAKELVRDLEAKGVESYVHRKR
ncbi:MAG: SPOR domain-containing protein [Saprospiraceae bacterium]